MTAAFEWSPGGCCCPGLPGWFDVYQSTTAAQGGRIVRLPIAGEENAVNNDSFNAIGWGINPSTAVFSPPAPIAACAPGVERLWRVEGPAGTEIFQAVLYDAVTQNELSRATVPNRFAGGSLSTYLATSDSRRTGVNPDQIGYVDFPASSLTVASAGGAVQTQTFLHTGPITVTNIAPSDWPRGAGRRTVSGRVEFLVGDITIANGILTLANTTTFGPDATSGSIHSFDSFAGHWAAIIEYTTPSNIPQIALWIDGVEIESFNAARDSTTPTATGPVRQASAYYRNVHVAFPHQSLGGGWVAVPRIRWLQYPTYWHVSGAHDGQLADPVYSYVIDVYQSGAFSWRTAGMRVLSSVNNSSSRWIWAPVPRFFTDQFNSVPGEIPAQMTGGLVTVHDSPANAANIYFFRHDGSQIIPAGRDHATPKRIDAQLTVVDGFDNGTQADIEIRGHIVRNCDLVPNTAPADLAFLTL